MVDTQPNGVPSGYLSLSDELLEQRFPDQRPTVQFARRGQVADALYWFGYDNPANLANQYPNLYDSMSPFDIYQGKVGEEVWNIPLYNQAPWLDYQLDGAALAPLQTMVAPEARFVDQVYG